MNHMHAIAPTTFADPDAALEPLLAEIRTRAREFTALRHVPRDVVERFKAVGVYRAMVARELGGEEWAPARFMALVERISAADGSAGWVASFGAAATYLASLPEPTLRAIYANGPDVVFSGAMFPPQPAHQVPGGVRVNGRWPFGSGSMGADLIGVGITIPDDNTGGLPRVAVMPAPQVRIDQNWHVMGLQGTGSHDLVVEDVEVPDERLMIRGGAPTIDAAIYRYPAMALAAQVLAAVGLGIARGALDDAFAASQRGGSITGAPKAADRPQVQSALALAEAELRSARCFFYDATETAWREVQADGRAQGNSVAMLRLASTQAARRALGVVRTCFEMSGTAAIRHDHRLAVALADASVVTQHAFLAEGTLQQVGRVLLGQPSAPGFS